jgi:hypothetical protein
MAKLRLLNPKYEGEAPAGRLAARLASLEGARIGLLDNDKPKAGRLLEHVAGLLRERHGVGGFLRVRKGSATRPAEEEHIRRLLGEADAVVTAIGD